MTDLNKTYEDRELEACTWIAKIDGGSATPEDLDALKAWLSEHPENKQAFEPLLADFMSIRDLLSTVGEAVHDLEDAASHTTALGRWFASAKRNWGLMGIGGAALASIVWVMLVVGVFGNGLFLGPWSDAPVYYASKVGGLETIKLDDGSTIILNTNTEVSVEYSPIERRVHLVKGEAIFNVAKDADRPFRVHTNKTIVKALGTVFSVRSLEGNVELLVEEGLVEFTANTLSDSFESVTESHLSESLLVSSGGYTTFESKTKKIIEQANVVELVERRMAWRSGMLQFESDPLREVVREYNRYIDQKIIIDDPALNTLAIAGAFPIGETEAFIDALEKGFGVKTVYLDDNTIRLIY